MKKTYAVYAKRLQNNIGNETSLVGEYTAKTKNEACTMAMCDYTNQGFYDNTSFFAIQDDN